MGKADGLSRRPDWEAGVEKDNEEQILVKKEWLEAKRIRVTEVIIEGVDVLDKVRKCKARDDKVVKAVEEMKRAGVKMLRDEEWRQEDGLMLKEGKVYVPRDEKLRAEVIRLHHDTPVGGHGGQWKTAELVTRNFWWPGCCQDPRDNPGSPSEGMRLRQEELDRVPSMNCLAIYISTCGYAKTILREITVSISYHLSSPE